METTPLRFDILTLFPTMFAGFLQQSILKRATDKQLIDIQFHNFRDYSTSKHQKVDDTPFGGGAGMVLMAQPIVDCIEKLQSERIYDEVIYLTPDGELFNQPMANELSLTKNLIFICGRYKGIDQRIRDKWVTKEVSIGEYVITGGELGAAIIIDAISRLIPGVLGDESSALTDSFQGELLDAPLYTQPADYRGVKVPEVLLSGNHKLIDAWRYEQSVLKESKYKL
jgi:tRNA (guanine37-N1)-methyltransferase